MSFPDPSKGPIGDKVVEYEGVNVSCQVVYPEGIFVWVIHSDVFMTRLAVGTNFYCIVHFHPVWHKLLRWEPE